MTDARLSQGARFVACTRKGPRTLLDPNRFTLNLETRCYLPAMTPTTRSRALSLYRQLLRAAAKMPTPNRQNFVLRKTRAEFRRHRTLKDAEEIEFQLRLADTNLDTVLVQAEHLSKLMRDPKYLMDV